MSKRGYVCPTCGGTVTYPSGKRLSEATMKATQVTHEHSCPGRARNNAK